MAETVSKAAIVEKATDKAQVLTTQESAYIDALRATIGARQEKKRGLLVKRYTDGGSGALTFSIPSETVNLADLLKKEAIVGHRRREKSVSVVVATGALFAAVAAARGVSLRYGVIFAAIRADLPLLEAFNAEIRRAVLKDTAAVFARLQ